MARFNLYGSDSVNRESVFIFYLVGPTVIDPMVGPAITNNGSG
jgi:hypothetical protein